MNHINEPNTGSGPNKKLDQAKPVTTPNKGTPSMDESSTDEPSHATLPVGAEIVNAYNGNKNPAKEQDAKLDATSDSKLGSNRSDSNKSSDNKLDGKNSGKAPRAAEGDDDLMSQPATGKAEHETLKQRWQKQITNAKSMWTKLTEPELTSIEGQAHKLADLVQKRYVTTREEADKQVTGFFTKHMPDVPSSDEIKGNWKQQVGAAKIAWGKLTEDELLKTEGQQMRLTGLVQARYAIHRDEADKQVKAFFDKNKAS